MGTITFDYRNPTQSGVDVATSGFLTARLWQREVVEGTTRTIAEFKIWLVNGTAEAVLSDTSVNQCWVLIEGDDIPGARTWFKAVAGNAHFTELADVNPETFDVVTAGSTIAAQLADKQPLNPNLTEIADLTTEAFGRGLLETEDAEAARTTLGVSSTAEANAAYAAVGPVRVRRSPRQLATAAQAVQAGWKWSFSHEVGTPRP